MKISKLFHWLYATLMFLPFVSVVSTSLYYAFNKNAVVPQVQQSVSKQIDFNQIGYPKDLNDTDTYSDTGQVLGYTFSSIDLVSGNKYQVNFKLDINDISIIYAYRLRAPYLSDNLLLTAGDNLYCYQFIADYNYPLIIQLMKNTDIASYVSFSFSNFEIFNLTQMFGIGDEPSIQQFNTWFPNDYYDYTLSEHQVIANYDVVDIADSPVNHFWLPSFGYIGYSIESGMSYILYNIFGLNVVNGIGYVINKLFTYWLIISICWLIFDVFMYVPNLVHKWLDKGAIE